MRKDSHLRRWGAVYDAEDIERIEAKVDNIQEQLGLPEPERAG